MRNLLLVFAVLAAVYVWQNYGHEPEVVANPAEYFNGHDQDVIMYATSWCPYCKKMRAWFSENNIRYFEYDIEKSDTGRRQFEALGGRGVPLVLVRDQLIKGYNPGAVKRALEALQQES
jgi:mycoredoxin